MAKEKNPSELPKETASASKTPKNTSAKSTASKPTAPKSSKSTATSAVSGAPKEASAKAPAKNANANATQNMEHSKEDELQQKVSSNANVAMPKRHKNTLKKLMFTLVLLLLVAAVVVVVLMVLKNNDSSKVPNIELTNPTLGEATEELDFEQEWPDYQLGDIVERGIAIKNTSKTKIAMCFKLEIYQNKEETPGDLPIVDLVATPNWDSVTQLKWTKKEIVENGVVTQYYYFNDVVKAGDVNVLFQEYKISTADVLGGNDYANATVYPRVTVYYTGATNSNVDNLESLDPQCWKNAPDDWINLIKQKI